MELFVKSKNNKTRKPSVIDSISSSGWVVGQGKAYGDLYEDCEIYVTGLDKLKKLRKAFGMTQADVAVLLNISRPTYASVEAGKRDLTLKEYLILQKLKGTIIEAPIL